MTYLRGPSKNFVFFMLLFLFVMEPMVVSGNAFNSTGAQRDGRARLYTDLEASPILQNKLVPLSHDSPIDVQILLNVYKILEIVEPKQVITMAVFYEFKWKDKGFMWHPADYANVSTIYVPYDRAWHPEPIVLNSAVADFSLYPKPDYLRLSADGEFIITGGTIVHTHCYIDLTFFPFDSQVCSLILGLVGQDIVIAPNASKTDLIEGVDQHVSIPAEWQVTNHSIEVSPVQELPQVLYTVQLDRASLYYLLCVLGPMAATSQLTLLVFWIPPTSGERISFLMSIYVSATLYLGYVGDTLPRKPYSFVNAPRMVLFMVFSAIECVLVLIATIISMHLHTAEQKATQKMYAEETEDICRQSDADKDSNKTLRCQRDLDLGVLNDNKQDYTKKEEDKDLDLKDYSAQIYFEDKNLNPENQNQNVQSENKKIDKVKDMFVGKVALKCRRLEKFAQYLTQENKNKMSCSICAKTFDRILFIFFLSCSVIFYLKIFNGAK